MITNLTHRGKYIDDTGIPGESRADLVAPAHVNAMQIAPNRFLVLVSTLGFRGTDDNRSILWQLRRDGFEGPIINEGVFAQSIDDWYPLGDQWRCVRQYGHPVIFGVPKGALINGDVPTHANIFAVKWRKVARQFNAEGGNLMWMSQPPEIRQRTQCVEWCQFRLNAAGDDLDMLMAPRELRQAGYESGDAICERDVARMNQSYVVPIPLNATCSEWVDVNHFNLHQEVETLPKTSTGKVRVAPLRYRFNESLGLYEWVETGPLSEPGYFEASIASQGDQWVIAARLESKTKQKTTGVGWTRVADPFAQPLSFTVPDDVKSSHAPLSIYTCPDGILRLCTGDATISPHQSNRNPIFIWDIDPEDGFSASNRRQIIDTYEAGIPIIKDHGPLADMIKILPHTGGREQLLIHRVRTCAMAVKEADYPSRIRPLTDGDFTGTAVYKATLTYDRDYPPAWTFQPEGE